MLGSHLILGSDAVADLGTSMVTEFPFFFAVAEMSQELFDRMLVRRRLDRFREFHRANPHVYSLFRAYARQAKSAGRTRIGARSIGERIRWFTTVETIGDNFKINDHCWPYYARMLAIEEPEFRGFFQTRDANFDGSLDEIRELINGDTKETNVTDS